ncbi:hypothetical protein CANARDRAFT_204474 [[Candida] arabinofermentans NRRL YB-2248]|uniref:Major facilitator superfamily (MFS) profile domain-containing protein n=1 Tax=[Candida] arabinofermentans NRRL YB-2248 TaxID=983967 RepID=A0A1E4STH2_9ASCO|nr:hypothetical protein CANARDRAFT_204474 [[Candida] arabinofermentans NRRL YB-2248]
MNEYTDKYHMDFVPGTVNLTLSQLDTEALNENPDSTLKTTKDGIILHPQPTNSPNDPLNWSTWTKIAQFSIILFITGFTAATSNDAGSIQDSMNEIYDISYDSMNTGAGVLFAAIGLSTVLLGPCSSLYGRKITYFICILLGLCGAAWFGAAKDTTDTIWSQLFVGASEGCAEAQVQLSLSDMYYSHQLGVVLTGYILATSVGTYLGPLIAGFIVEYAGFRWVGWCAVIISGVLLGVLILFQYETMFDRAAYFGNISYGKKQKISTIDEKKNDGNGMVDVSSQEELDDDELDDEHVGGVGDVGDLGANEPKKSYYENIKMITLAPSVIGTGFKQYIKILVLQLRVFSFPPVLLSGLLWGLQDAFLTFYLTTEDDNYYDPPWSYSDTGVALMNLPCVIGALIGCLYAGYFSDRFVIWLSHKNGGIQEAEYRLWFLFPAAIISPVGMLLFGLGTYNVWSWKVTYTVGLGFIGFGFATSGDIAMGYLMDAYPEMVLEGMIGVAFINNMIGCIFTFTCSMIIDALGTKKTYIMLAIIDFGTFLFIIPFLLYGKEMRKWTKSRYIEFVELRDGMKQ